MSSGPHHRQIRVCLNVEKPRLLQDLKRAIRIKVLHITKEILKLVCILLMKMDIIWRLFLHDSNDISFGIYNNVYIKV